MFVSSLLFFKMTETESEAALLIHRHRLDDITVYSEVVVLRTECGLITRGSTVLRPYNLAMTTQSIVMLLWHIERPPQGPSGVK